MTAKNYNYQIFAHPYQLVLCHRSHDHLDISRPHHWPGSARPPAEAVETFVHLAYFVFNALDYRYHSNEYKFSLPKPETPPSYITIHELSVVSTLSGKVHPRHLRSSNPSFQPPALRITSIFSSQGIS